MTTAVIQVRGAEELLKKMQAVPHKLRANAVRKALAAAGGVVKRAAQNIVRKQTGSLQHSLAVKVVVPNDPRRPARAIIGPARGYAEFFTVRGKKRKQVRTAKKEYRRLVQLLDQKPNARARIALARKIAKPLVSAHLVRVGKQRHLGLAITRFAKSVVLHRHRGVQVRVPTRYAHLVEKGTRNASARPFLRPALVSVQAQALAAMQAQMAAALQGSVR